MTAEADSLRMQIMQKTAAMWDLWSKGKPSQALKAKREIDELERRHATEVHDATQRK